MSNKTPKNIDKIMVFGTFDGVHAGHLDFFKQAKRLSKNPFLVVSIARDQNVKKIKKNLPNFSEKKRLTLVKNTKLADKVILGGVKNYLSHILKVDPKIIALGYDQKHYVKNLKQDLSKLGHKIKIVRLKAYKKNVFKNHLLKKRAGI
jgi:cytidyltransferase-like protein